MIKKLLLLLGYFTIQSYALIFPIFSYSGESGTILGGFIQQKISDESLGQLFLLSQEKGQAGFLNITNLPIAKNKVNLKLYGSNPGESYYGIGNISKKTETNNLYFNKLSTTITIEQKLTKTWDSIYGLSHNYYKENTSKNNQSDVFKPLNDIGFILGLQMDRRDQEFNTKKGYFNEIKLSIFNEHQIFSNDVRYFHPTDFGLLATKFFTTQTFTTKDHFIYLSGIGNYYYLRGYKTNDIIDRHLSYTQFEWRKHITSWFILTPFIEAGIIGSSLQNIKKSLFSYGLGAYFPIGNGSFRLDFAYAEENSEFYFGFNHVF